MTPSTEPDGIEPPSIDTTGGVTESTVVACETRPGRLVFTERGNCDAWIATSLVIDPSE